MNKKQEITLVHYLFSDGTTDTGLFALPLEKALIAAHEWTNNRNTKLKWGEKEYELNKGKYGIGILGIKCDVWARKPEDHKLTAKEYLIKKARESGRLFGIESFELELTKEDEEKFPELKDNTHCLVIFSEFNWVNVMIQNRNLLK